MGISLYRGVVTVDWERIEIDDTPNQSEVPDALRPLIDGGDFAPHLLTPDQRAALDRIIEGDHDWKSVVIMDQDITHYELESHS